MSRDEVIAGIEAALDALLGAIAEARPRKGGTYSAGQLAASGLDRFSQTKAQQDAEDLIADPVGRALRNGVRRLGERLHELGGVAKMQDVLDQVSEKDEARLTWRMDVMDKCWDGIGVSDPVTGAFIGWAS